MATAKRSTAKRKATKTAAATDLAFPRVSTRHASGRASNDYDKLGIPFKTPAGDKTMDLAQFFGDTAIRKIKTSKKLIFHLMGDSGVGTREQEEVADAMARDIDDAHHEDGPSFMLNLGDILYGSNKEAGYADRFYRMYDHYDRLIFGIPGNHDGEIRTGTDPDTLAAFITNFCAAAGKQPPLAKQFGMLMPNQPGPYWHLKAPFLDLVSLYSNADENVGIIANAMVGTSQKDWLEKRLKEIAAAQATAKTKRNALVIAVHHPPFARGFDESAAGHPGSPEMLQDIDDCCKAAGVLPDAVIAGHTHSYQHYVRTQTLNNATSTIPYLIVGTGGIGLQRLPAPTGVKNSTGDVLYFSAFKDHGYVLATAAPGALKLVFVAINATHRELREEINIDLASRSIV